MLYKNKKSIIERSRKFWTKEKTDRPMVGMLYNRLAPLSTSSQDHLTNRKILPKDISEDMFIKDCDRRATAAEQLIGDSMFVAYPFIGLPWLDAVMGSSFSISGGSAWVESNADWKIYQKKNVSWGNGWFDLMLDQLKLAISHSKERYPVGPCHLRGIGDVVAGIVGQEEFCYSLYDEPERIKDLIQITTDAWIKIVNSMFDILVQDEGGYWNGNQPIWCPGKTMFVPADIVSLVSRDMFKEFFVEPLEKMMIGFDYSIMHTHSNYLHAVDDILHIDQLKAVQIGIDPNGPSVEEMLPILHRIMEKKSLIISGDTDTLTLKKLIQHLPTEGLCILIYKETITECNTAYKKLEEVL